MSHALPGSRCTRSPEGAQPGEVTWTGQRNIPHHRMHAQYINWGELTQSYWSQLRDSLASVNRWRTTVFCTTYFSWVLFVFFLFNTNIIFYVISVIKPTGSTFIQFPPHSTGGQGTSGCTVPTNQAELKAWKVSNIYGTLIYYWAPTLTIFTKPSLTCWKKKIRPLISSTKQKVSTLPHTPFSLKFREILLWLLNS